MRILIDLTHPVDVHFFLRPLRLWRDAGHEVLLVARDKDVLLPLLAELELAHAPLGRAGRGALGLGVEWLTRVAALARLMRRERPDVACGFGATFVVPAARLLGVRSVAFTDTEQARLSNALTLPLASLTCTPRCYPVRVRGPQLRFEGYKELAYLAPRYFTPDPGALALAGLAAGEPYVFVRTVAWRSGHDFFDHGFTDARAVVDRLGRHARVVLSAEGPLPADLEPLRYRGPLAAIHHLLAFARLYLGESATMGAESAVLGTPALVVSTSRRSYLDDLEQRYGLARTFSHPGQGQDQALAAAEALLADPATGATWQGRRARMLAEQEDVVAFVAEAVAGRRRS